MPCLVGVPNVSTLLAFISELHGFHQLRVPSRGTIHIYYLVALIVSAGPTRYIDTHTVADLGITKQKYLPGRGAGRARLVSCTSVGMPPCWKKKHTTRSQQGATFSIVLDVSYTRLRTPRHIRQGKYARTGKCRHPIE